MTWGTRARQSTGARRGTRMIRRAAVVGAALVLGAFQAWPAAAGAASITDTITGPARQGRVLVVDDDHVQCPTARFDSMQAALLAASDGDRVRVCAGLYRGPVTIDASVTVQGEIGAVASFDCLDPVPGVPDDLDPTRFAIIRPPLDQALDGPLVRIAADDVDVSGLVVERHRDPLVETPGPGISLYDAAIAVSDAWSRTRIHHDVVRSYDLGIELGAPDSRVDHNCLRDNDFALANQRYPLARARIDDNTTFGSLVRTFEIGWTFRGTSDVRVDHNTSVEDAALGAYWVENGVRPQVVANVVRAARVGVTLRVSSNGLVSANDLRAGTGVISTRNTGAVIADNRIAVSASGVALGGGNDGVAVVRNSVTGLPGAGTAGIILVPPAPAPVNRDIAIETNVVSGLHGAGGAGVTVSSGSVVTGSVVRANELRDNSGSGILVARGVSGLVVSDNVASGNVRDGIRLEAGTSDNVLQDNEAMGNGTDARDESGVDAATLLNEWARTTCVTDVPVGAICVAPAVG